MRDLLAAIRFLTIFHLGSGRNDEKSLPRSMSYFPVVGLILGLMLVAANNACIYLQLNALISNVLLVILLLVFTGGLHMDGLADTFDGLLCGKTDKDAILDIMRDPHAGTMGILAIISAILLKISLLLSISAGIKPVSLILMCVLSRWSPVLSMSLFPYGRKNGKAGVFIKGVKPAILIISTMIAVFICYLSWQVPGLSVFVVTAVFTCLFGMHVTRRIGGITGDTLGASVEINEIMALFAVYMLSRII